MNKTSPTLVERIERWPIDQLLPFANNSRTHSPTQIAQIAGSISEFGFVNPILMGPDNVIVAGHARALAARQLGLTDVPVIVLAHLTPPQRRALVIADNRLALSAAWDEEMLHLELSALRDADFDLDLLGFNDEKSPHCSPMKKRRKDSPTRTRRRNRRKHPSRSPVISGPLVATECSVVMQRLRPMFDAFSQATPRIWSSPILPITSLTRATPRTD